ncbi:MAG: proline dehydrogenase [Planctomycetota bacterium]|jgi:proline dehydrogenase
MGLFDRIAIAAIPLVPRPIMRSLASRYIAGETLGEAIAELTQLQQRGHTGIVDLLGEDVEDAAAAKAVVDDYREVATSIQAAGLDAYVSIKPTHLGLRISEQLCLENYREMIQFCGERGQFVRVEMEDHTTTDATLRIFETLRGEFDSVGVVLQSRLFRTKADIEGLLHGPNADRPLSVRMVKGIYLEPANVAHITPVPIREQFLLLSRLLLENGARVSFATHDGPMGAKLIALVKELGLSHENYEFQVLLGVQEALWNTWKDSGHPVRVYVPYGPEWRAYSTRRLGKNPEIFRHVLRDLMPWN